MRRFLPFIVVALVFACNRGDFIKSQAKNYAVANYGKLGKSPQVTVTPVTIGDNLDYRIEQGRSNQEFAAMLLRDFGHGEEDLARITARTAALDSLKGALGDDVLSEITAYDCVVAYETGDTVWVQMTPTGILLRITRDAKKRFVNPGEDAPGYAEINDRFKLK